MDPFHVVRRKVPVEGIRVRAAARELKLRRKTIRKYLADPAPLRVETASRRWPVRGLEARIRARVLRKAVPP